MHTSEGWQDELSHAQSGPVSQFTNDRILFESSNPLYESLICLMGSCLGVCSKAAERAWGQMLWIRYPNPNETRCINSQKTSCSYDPRIHE